MIITDVQEITLSINPVNALGNPAILLKLPTWTSSDLNIISLNVATDGLSVIAMSMGKLGIASIVVSDGQSIGVFSIEVISSAAKSFTVSAGAPQPIPSVILLQRQKELNTQFLDILVTQLYE